MFPDPVEPVFASVVSASVVQRFTGVYRAIEQTLGVL